MISMNTYFKREGKTRRKQLLRAFREDQQARIWNQVMDEAGSCDISGPDADSRSFDFEDPVTQSEFEDFDENYPNKLETLHNVSNAIDSRTSTHLESRCNFEPTAMVRNHVGDNL